MGDTQEPNKKLAAALDIHAVINVLDVPRLHARRPYFNGTTGIDPHLGHKALRLGEVQGWVGKNVLMADHDGCMVILRHACQFRRQITNNETCAHQTPKLYDDLPSNG